MKNKSLGVTLIEIVVAVLILSVAVIPIAALIGRDTKDTVILSHSQFAMSLARTTMDAMLDGVDFDDLQIGDPAMLSGGATASFYLDMCFPNSSGNMCHGIVEHKGYQFDVYLRAQALDNSFIGLSAFKNPDINLFFQNATSTNSAIQDAILEESKLRNKPSVNTRKSIYADSSWARDLDEQFDVDEYMEAQNVDHLMKLLTLTITWNDKKPRNPLASGSTNITLVTHKARLKKVRRG